MKIVIIPGVGFFKDKIPDKKLFKDLSKIPNVELEWYNWKHYYDATPDMHKLNYVPIRDFACEVILDFETVVNHAFDVPVPHADVYIGHSAGSILALIQPRPCIIFGSPACLIESIQKVDAVDCLLNSHPVLNIIHKKDILAYPVQSANNNYFTTCWWNLSYVEPISAHTCYWDDPYVCKLISNTIREWQKDSLL